MKVLLVTGKIAEGGVRKIAAKYGCGVYVAPVDVISCLEPDTIEAEGYDMIIVPGLVRWDLEAVERRTGIKTYLGPKDLADLELMLDHLGSIELSKTVPACEFLRGELRKRALDEIARAGSPEYAEEMLRRPGSMLIGDLPVGRDFPMRVLAEIVDVGTLTEDAILKKARYYIESGADIVDLGFNERNPGKVREAVGAVKGLGVPISVDTMDRANIEAGLDAGADLILSFDRALVEEFEDMRTPSVIIPKDGGIPGAPAERVKLLNDNITLAKKRGFENILADPVLHPVNFGFVQSVEAYRRFSGDYPMLMGVGNITETFDADSAGMNALLCGIAGECGASLLFTTEASAKTKGCVKELKASAQMIYLARKRGSFPKDLGIDLLRVKKKRA
ncbi:MAG: dihydropteroate synthase-like protein [Candidatus Hydrothermarchaeaceae archaeon]